MTTVNIIFLVDSRRCTSSQGGVLSKPQYYPGGNGDNGHPPLIWGTGNNPSTYTHQSGDTPVPVTAGDEVYISIQDVNALPNVVFAPVGFVAMRWNNEPMQKSQVSGGDAVIGDISFRDTRNDLFDYDYVPGQNSDWSPDQLNSSFWITTHDASLGQTVKRGPYLLLPTLQSCPGRLDYGIEFYCTVNGQWIGTYEFDPTIVISQPAKK